MTALTLGMATHDDYHGVAFTIQSLAMHQDLTDCEIIVIDNAPSSRHGKQVKVFCGEHASRPGCPVRYIPLPDQKGTTQTRERIFSEAAGDAVLVMDCHVLFPLGAIARLKTWLAEHPDNRDLLSGPLILTHLNSFHTHFNDQWRGGMWGTWATAWACKCEQPTQLTTIQVKDRVTYWDLATSRKKIVRCEGCKKVFPVVPWAGHEVQLVKTGFQPLGFRDDDEPFDIPAQGLGVFACRKAAWPGFNPHFRGFGGEEFFIHDKFRQLRRRVLCLPFLKWWHRFGRPDGAPYVNRTWDRVRNYVLGHTELGQPLDDVYRHFVSLDTYGESLTDHLRREHSLSEDALKGQRPEALERLHRGLKISQSQWQFLIADPVGHLHPPQTTPSVEVNFDTGRPQPPEHSTLDEIFDWAGGIKRDLDEHLPALRDLAAKCDHVTEITKRRESTVALLAGRPRTLVSYQREHDFLLKTLSDVVKREGDRAGRKTEAHTVHWLTGPGELNAIEPTQLLFIDSIHTAERLTSELAVHGPRVNRFIAMRGTGAFGEAGQCPADSPCKGLLNALKPWMEAHPDWFIYLNTDKQYGLTVIGRREEDRPAKPIHAWPPGYGPGTRLKAILAALGINPQPSCDCNAKALLMDKQGVRWCQENRDMIIGWLREGAPRWKWTDQLAAATQAVFTGYVFRLSPIDRFGSLVDEAIRQAEEELALKVRK